MYLAVARSDNVTHVYDVRFLTSRHVLYELPHLPADEGMKDLTQFGVPKIEWLEDPHYGLGLVSAGGDGSFRLLDAFCRC